jgi:hypothetical protein
MNQTEITQTSEDFGWSRLEKVLAGMSAILFAGGFLFTPLFIGAAVTGVATMGSRQNAAIAEAKYLASMRDKALAEIITIHLK